MTAYTPYQPEISQGTLQTEFEFQTLCAQLTGMDVANAGMYDGSTSLAEAVLMASRVTRRTRVAVLDSVSPAYISVLRTYAEPPGITIDVVSADNPNLNEDTRMPRCPAAQLLGLHPGYAGNRRPSARRRRAVRRLCGRAVNGNVHAARATMARTIVASEGQALGVPPTFGGSLCRHFRLQAELHPPDARPNRGQDG